MVPENVEERPDEKHEDRDTLKIDYLSVTVSGVRLQKMTGEELARRSGNSERSEK